MPEDETLVESEELKKENPEEEVAENDSVVEEEVSEED